MELSYILGKKNPNKTPYIFLKESFSVYIKMIVTVAFHDFFQVDEPVLHFIRRCIMASHIFYFIS